MTGIDVITVRDAARGDGIQDDAPPFTKAITAASAKGGGLVFVDFGTYFLKSVVSVPANVTVLVSAGASFTGTGYLSVAGGSVVDLRNGLTTTGQYAPSQATLDLANNNGNRLRLEIAIRSKRHHAAISHGGLRPQATVYHFLLVASHRPTGSDRVQHGRRVPWRLHPQGLGLPLSIPNAEPDRQHRRDCRQRSFFQVRQLDRLAH
jgi:hypothetical protein